MTELTWEKVEKGNQSPQSANKNERLKFLIGGLLLLAAVGYLIVSSTIGGTQYFITVDELMSNPDYVGQTVRITGAVIGETIVYDQQTLMLDFTVANVPTVTDDLALTLHEAVSNPDATRLPVHLENEVKPDLLQHEAQAIMTGQLGSDGVFYASELLLKCPSRYEENAPVQMEEGA